MARAAKDEAERLRDREEEVWQEIIIRLGKNGQRSRADFAAVTVAPAESADVPDGDEARLVIMHPRHTFRKNGSESEAQKFAREALNSRGSAQRRHRNALIFLAPDTRRMEELEAAVRDFLAWKSIAGRARELNLTPNQVTLAETRRDENDRVVGQRIDTSYIWVIFPDQPNADRPMEVSEVKAESQADTLAGRVTERLRREGQLAAVHTPRAIAQQLTGPLRALWERGYISVGDLWELYTTYPYLPRLKDRSVMEDAVREVLNSITWELEGFALATGRAEDTGAFTGLAIPHRDSFGIITDAVLLVRPDIALEQRPASGTVVLGDATGTTATGAGTGGPVVRPGGAGTGGAGTGGAAGAAGPTAPPTKVRYYAVLRVDPEKYGRDLTRLQQEILPHLADADAGDLTITVEIEATRPGGFPEDKIRIITENARALNFRPVRLRVR